MNAERTTAGTTSSRSASASTMMQFLPPISAITRLRWCWAGGVSAAVRMISWPTAEEPRQRVRRHARLPQRAHEHVRAAGRLLRGLEHDGVAGGEPGGDHAAGD